MNKMRPVRGYRGRTTTAEYVIRRANRYDVGFQKSSDGNYEMVTDFSSAHLNTRLQNGRGGASPTDIFPCISVSLPKTVGSVLSANLCLHSFNDGNYC
ncbi:MAG: DUF1257 domain-containing protein [Cyanobacteria bacterium P01_F01_bin.150]